MKNVPQQPSREGMATSAHLRGGHITKVRGELHPRYGQDKRVLLEHFLKLPIGE